MNQLTNLLAKIAFFLAGITSLLTPSAEAQKPAPPPLKVLAGPQFYDFLMSVAVESGGAAAWYAGLTRASERSDGPIKQLLEHRLALLTTRGGTAVEVWRASLANMQDPENAERSGEDTFRNALSTLLSSVTETSIETEIRLLALAVDGVENPGSPEVWNARFSELMAASDSSWRPNFSAFAYLLASDHAIASGNTTLELELSLWARIHADAGDRTTLRRAARERILVSLERLNRLDSELAQGAALPLVDRGRVSEYARQLALKALRLEGRVDIEGVKTLARRIASDGPNQQLSTGKPLPLRSYLVASLQTLCGPGPTSSVRKRLPMFEQAIAVAEDGDAEIAVRLKVPYLTALLRMERFALVAEMAKPVWDQANSHGLDALSAEVSIVASLASAQIRRPDLQEFWRATTSDQIADLLQGTDKAEFAYAPRQVLWELLGSRATSKADRVSARAIAKLSESPTKDQLKSLKVEARIAEKSSHLALQWTLLIVISATLVGCFCVVALTTFLSAKPKRALLESQASAPQPVALLGVSEGSVSNTQPSELSSTSTSLSLEDSSEGAQAKVFGNTSFQLGALMRDTVADLQRRTRGIKIELASDSNGDYGHNIDADYAKIRRLARRLGLATSRAAEGTRIMVGGMLRESSFDASMTLELSFTYPLPSATRHNNTSSLGDSWAEDNVLASLVHLLNCNVNHQQEDGLGCLLASVPLSALLSSDHTAGDRTRSHGNAILVVDTDPRVLRSMCAALQALGCDCQCSESVEAARTQLGQPGKYAIVILEISLANDDSFRLAQEILKMPDDVRPAIIAMGNREDAGGGSRAASLVFDDYLTKPYTLERLASVVHIARID